MQIVGYDTGVNSEGPALLLAREGRVEREALSTGRDLAYTLQQRHCAGVIEEDRHLSCGNASAPWCDDHTSRWACARCRGQCDMPLESCHEEHAIYLAAFAPATFKVGVTRSWRLDTRLREQGADRAAHLRTVDDGRIARQIEADIATTVGDRVRVPTKIEGIHQSVDETAWDDLLLQFDPIETFTFDYGLDLAERPVAETLLTGTVHGTQGRVLVLERNGSTYAVNMRDLVGYDVVEEPSSRDLQASLGSFG